MVGVGIVGLGNLSEMGAALGKGICDFQRALKPPPEIDVTPPQHPAQDPEKLV